MTPEIWDTQEMAVCTSLLEIWNARVTLKGSGSFL